MRDLAAALAAEVIGQSAAIDALVTALVGRESVYLAGAPGCGKTLLAERFAGLASERSRTLAFHRDTTLRNLLGDSGLERERVAGAERLRLQRDTQGLDGTHVLVLDDPARAAASVLGPLWSRLDRDPRPEVAVATGPLLGEDAAVLPHAALDRFALRVHMRGIVASTRAADARRLMDHVLNEHAAGARLDPRVRVDAQNAARALAFPPAARAALAEAIAKLRTLCDEDADVHFTDRFARSAVRLMRAHAHLRSAARVEPHDVAVLRLTLYGRVPDARLAEAGEQLEAVSESRDARAPVAGSGVQPGPGGGPAESQVEAHVPAIRDVELERVQRGGPFLPAEDVAPLVRALEGAFARGTSAAEERPGGLPRDYRRLRTLDEIFDADPGEAWSFAAGRSVEPPRVLRRERSTRGGAVAVLRDVSASMEGRLGRFAGDVVRALARIGEQRDLRLAYVEFHHTADRYVARGRPFHRRYRAVAALGARRRAEGRTSYAAPLRAALGALAHAPVRGRHVLLLTDGVPVVGDPRVLRERQRARALGVQVHTVFIGTGVCPTVLDALSVETGGLRFRVRPGRGGRLLVEQRECA